MAGTSKWSRWWPVVGLALLLPMWCVGLFGRGYWTPDEPREADIAWHMKSQQQRALPQLGGKPFMEKPPLTYWMTAASMKGFGDTPAASRLPNLLYAIVAAMAIGALAEAMAGPAAALTATIVMASSLLSWRVAVWVAPDAALVAGCSLALLGAYRGYLAAAGRRKLLWYSLLHLGALLGFMAKSAPGWLVPGLAMLVLIVWERRWSELRRPELYAGLPLQLLAIGLWVRAVWMGDGGGKALRVLFWNNLAGRFAHIDAPSQFNYAEGHQNWLGKYFVQLPSYLYPWTLLALAAIVCAWQQLRRPTANATAWRYAVSLTLPFLLLLTMATTARDVYAAPVLGGFAIMVALWLETAPIARTALDRWALRSTAVLISLLTLICVVAISAIAASGQYATPVQAAIAIGAMLVALIWLLRRAAAERRQHRLHRSLLWSYAAFALPFVIAAQLLFPAIDRAQDLPALANEVRSSLGQGNLALLNPDETTIAMMNFRRADICEVIESEGADAAADVRRWFAAHAAGDRILVKLPGRALGPLTPLLQKFSRQRPPDDGEAAALQRAGAATLLAHFELPHGRRYGLLGPASTVLAVALPVSPAEPIAVSVSRRQ